ncbi:E3 ubiquitin-protein ligase RLIM-like [Macadamia integrifolia]|uniref:E3 ubiquitin-protein ligase RLIM-like n=1 Tax=Macadamia integrifolia TaxID=60698 RepID=UPI001C4F5BA6|nr:E3 ubiquitin-protein ligase RLIM-like [Macadamia integrifolia]XP_042488833.1 E3 ubiquitin-protein ligase RLIM-like [Macadamia integrifolia]
MGSSNSRLSPRPSRPRVNRSNRRFFPFICGGSSSYAPVEMEDCPAELVVNSSKDRNPIIADETPNSIKKPSSLFDSETECFSSRDENSASSESSNRTREETSVEYCSRSIASSKNSKCLSESNEIVPDQITAEFVPVEITSDEASAFFEEHEVLDSESAKVDDCLNAVIGADDTKTVGGSQIFEEGVCSSSTSHQELGDSCANAASSVGNHADAIMGAHSLDTDSIPSAFETQASSQSLEEESGHETVPPAPGFVVPDRERGRTNGSVLHVDVVSISSNILSSSSGEVSNHEARRNSRRMFWDAFSRRSSRRHIDSPTIVFSTEDADDLGTHDRWLLDFSGDLFEDGFGGDSGYFGSRRHDTYERRRSSRSEMWERLRGGIDESSRRTSFCASGLHPDGTCTCESFLMTEESGTRASISRIVMLAEALFEVLDGIHRQPLSLSLTVPAPESIVNSFPLKSHKSTADGGNDAEQCHICLAEYEEGDKIRVLPCRHEYHMACVDKWLKEIHGICPLCRGDVCEGVAQGTTISNP